MEALQGFRVPFDEDDRLPALVAHALNWPVERIGHIHYLRKSLDARKNKKPCFVYSLEVYAKDEVFPDGSSPSLEALSRRIRETKAQEHAAVVGSGPAGLFAALYLRLFGFRVTLLERGGNVGQRQDAIAEFYKTGRLNEDCNVGFGLGGAGLFSDGKLTTRIKHQAIRDVLHWLVLFGAPEAIRYIYNPHVGSDRLRAVIASLADWLANHDLEWEFQTRVTGLCIERQRVVGVHTETGTVRADAVVLACGHSARDVFTFLHREGVAMERKPFAVGLRVEHPQALIDQAQYGAFAGKPGLEAAQYRLTWNHEELERGVYSFCMCPGGHLINAATEADTVVANGMSNLHRLGGFANSAIVVTVDEREWDEGLFSGMALQRQLEQESRRRLNQADPKAMLPAQRVVDYLAGRASSHLRKTSSLSGAAPAQLCKLFPAPVEEALQEGLRRFDHKIRGFCGDQGLLYAVETRTSSPLRVLRDREGFHSISHDGLYPCGEGAGYAGGITSAAVDGIRVAQAIAARFEKDTSGIFPARTI